MQTSLQKFLTGAALWLIVLSAIFVSANAQALPPLYTNLKMGQLLLAIKVSAFLTQAESMILHTEIQQLF